MPASFCNYPANDRQLRAETTDWITHFSVHWRVTRLPFARRDLRLAGRARRSRNVIRAMISISCNTRSFGESFDPTYAWKGPQHTLLLLLSLTR